MVEILQGVTFLALAAGWALTAYRLHLAIEMMADMAQASGGVHGVGVGEWRRAWSHLATLNQSICAEREQLRERVERKDAEIQRLREIVRACCPGEEDPRD